MPDVMYICCVCGIVHKTMREAEECEGRHKVVKEVVKHNFHKGDKYPYELKVLFSDGSVKTYSMD